MAEEEGAAPAPNNKKKLIIIVVAVFLVLVLAGAAALLLGGSKDKKAKEDTHAAKEQAKPMFVVFEEKFTVNLQSEDGTTHYLQLPKLELEVASAEVAGRIDERKSKISDRISSVLRSRTMSQMLEPGSDIKLKADLKKVVNEALEVSPGEVAKSGVKEVIMPASFIVQ